MKMSDVSLLKDQVIDVLNSMKDLEWTEEDLKPVIYMVSMNINNRGSELSSEDIEQIALAYFEIKECPEELEMTNDMVECKECNRNIEEEDNNE